MCYYISCIGLHLKQAIETMDIGLAGNMKCLTKNKNYLVHVTSLEVRSFLTTQILSFLEHNNKQNIKAVVTCIPSVKGLAVFS